MGWADADPARDVGGFRIVLVWWEARINIQTTRHARVHPTGGITIDKWHSSLETLALLYGCWQVRRTDGFIYVHDTTTI